MTVNAHSPIQTPSAFRAYQNQSASVVIPKYRAVQTSGAFPGCALMTANSQVFLGVSVEELGLLGTGGDTRSIQKSERATIEAGAAFARGVKLTSDSVGRAIAASDPAHTVIGVSAEAAGALGDLAMVEL